MKTLVVPILCSVLIACSSSDKAKSQKNGPYLVGGPCEGCEAILEYGNQKLNHVDTLPDFHQDSTTIKVTGTVYKKDGKTPAPNVILYVYHTNQKGLYQPSENAKDWERRHGYIRGWVKSNRQGKYTFYTLKPAPYPNRSEPSHIHYTVLEPNGKYYWLGSSHFKGDSLLTKKEIAPEKPRGGNSGLLDLVKKGNILVGKRDIILGKNIPEYE